MIVSSISERIQTLKENIMYREISINGVKITPLISNEVIQDITNQLKKNIKLYQITFINAYVYCLAKRDEELNSIISNSNIVISDGISIVLAALLINRIKIAHSIMTHVFDQFLISDRVPVSSGILIGVTGPEVRKAMKAINEISHNINIEEAYSGYHSSDYYSTMLKKHQNINFILIGMSSPRSEYLCRQARDLCINSIIWHIGAGTIKCYAGTKKRAPKWLLKIGMEWIHRFFFEKHTRKRYLIYNFVFIYHMGIGLIKSFNRYRNKSER
jgi:N-acetylglucosaminyldiphosphoundecaprenol N-acetyl-beta-D-mannosaminyltransferase